MTLTPSQVRALSIVAAHGGVHPREFAKMMWPVSDGWDRSVKCGYGSHRGGGMYLAGGGYLGKLERLGLVTRHSDRIGQTSVWITTEGQRALYESAKEVD